MTNSLFNFKQYLKGWDLSIENLDNFEEQQKITEVIDDTINFINLQLAEWEEIAMKKNEEELLKLFDNKKYKEFKNKSSQLVWLRYKITDLFELKNRRTKQVFDLKAKLHGSENDTEI